MHTTLWYNGNIVTMRHAGHAVDAMCTMGEYIVATGTRDEMQAYANGHTAYVDLRGHTVIPGFIEPHNHVTDGFINEFVEIACHHAKDIDDVLQHIARKKDTLESGAWLLGTGFNDCAITEKRHLTRHDLDCACNDIPVALFHISGHILYVNTKALELCGITAHTPIPHGGKGEIALEANGMPSGVLLGHAHTLVTDKAPTYSKTTYMEAYCKGFALAHSLGITSVQDGAIGWLGNHKNILGALQALKAERKLGLRFYLTIMEEQFRSILDDGCTTGFGDSWLRLGCVKFLVDGSIQGYTASLCEPYHVPGSSNGIEHFTQKELNEAVLHAHKNHCQTALHCNGDAAIDLAINAIAHAQQEYSDFEGRHQIIHAQTIREDQLDRLATLKIIPSFFVNHVFHWGDAHRDTFLGEKRARRISPLGSAQKRGLPFTIHTDYPVTPLTPFRLLSCAVNRRTQSGAVLGKEQAVSMYDAVASLTSHAAYSSFEEHLKGTLEAGKLADFVILSQNIFAMDPLMVDTVSACATVLGGNIVHLNQTQSNNF